jgi:diguanylate cyclase (GGDEF)-like protein
LQLKKSGLPADDNLMPDTLRDSRAYSDLLESFKLPGYLGVVGVDAGGVVHYASLSLEARFGIKLSEAVGRSFLDFVHSDDVAQAIESFSGVPQRAGHHQSIELRLVSPLGQESAVDAVADNHLDDPAIGLVLISLADPRDRIRSVQLLSAQAQIVRQIALGGDYQSALVSILQFVEAALPGFQAIAYTKSGQTRCGVVVAKMSATLARRLRVAFDADASVPAAMAYAEHESIIAGDLGEPRWESAAAVVDGHASSIWSVPIQLDRGAPCRGVIDLLGPHIAHPRDEDWAILDLASRLAAIAHDHSELQDRLRKDATVDPLTLTANRRLITEELAAAMDSAPAGHVVCFIDIDRLKVVNDGLGHEAGDAVIRQAAGRLLAAIGDDGILGRFGGDEFVALIRPGSSHEDVAQRCLDAFVEPMWVVGRAWQMSVSMGIVVIESQRSPGEVLRDADAAMYEAKRAGRGRWRLFGGDTRKQVVRRLSLEHRLRAAVTDRTISAWFQPVISCRDWSLIGAEALARWKAPDGAWVSPAEFIPLAEELGLIDDIGDIMIDRAVEAVRALRAAGVSIAGVSVNVSPLQLQSELLFNRFEALRDEAIASSLCLEMTEQHIIDDSTATLDRLERLLATGVSLAVDDFGTGYSSLSALHRMPAKTLKIDRGVVSQVGSNAGNAVVAAVVGVARAYDMITVAEGVETAAEASLVRALGIDAVQGYLFARPEPLAAFTTRLTAEGWCWDVDPSDLGPQRDEHVAPTLPFGT